MDRKQFLKKSLTVGALGIAAPTLIHQTFANRTSDYDKLIAPVGFNHLPNKEETTMNSVLHKSGTRGHADHGWLKSSHTFSFANYYNPERMHFGVLRVLNDDTVSKGRGFSKHPHDNMEIISIPLYGDLEHKDSMGNTAVIQEGDVQVLSAGTGIYHSEYNKNSDKEVKFLQIWMFPNKKHVEPRYDQISMTDLIIENELSQIVSPHQDDQGVWVHQNAWFSIGKFTEDTTLDYHLHASENGVYAFVLEGELKINEQQLEKRDGYGIWDFESLAISAKAGAKVLLMEVPMSI